MECKDLFQVRQLSNVLSELRSHSKATLPLAKRVAPTALRRFLQAGSIIAYTRGLGDKAGPANKNSANGWPGVGQPLLRVPHLPVCVLECGKTPGTSVGCARSGTRIGSEFLQ